MDYQEWLYPTHYDEYELNSSMVSYWDHFLVFWKDVQEVDTALKGSQYVRGTLE
jgi:hypothetical protein